jgi:hypothetical protein
LEFKNPIPSCVDVNIAEGGTEVGLLGVTLTSKNFLQDANTTIIENKIDNFFIFVFLIFTT